METLPLWWPVVLLAAALFGDAIWSLRPPKFIRDCLDGVGFPRDWWWALIVVKLLAVAGLIAGLWVPGVALAATVGVATYFGAAVVAHVRARFFTSSFWVNCLGMLTLSIFVLLAGFVPW